MNLRPSLLTAAAAGLFTGVTAPLLWPLFADPRPSASLWLVLGMLACVALPAHAGVVGFAPEGSGRTVDVALLKRTVVWLALAATTAALMSLY